MFRNPRENAKLPSAHKLLPSTGRPPSPPAAERSTTTSTTAAPANKMATRTLPPRSSSTASAKSKSKLEQTTLTPQNGRRKTSSFAAAGKNGFGNGSKGRPKPNGSILSFFKKAEDSPANSSNGLFLEERTPRKGGMMEGAEEEMGWDDDVEAGNDAAGDERFNELGGSVKRRRLSPEVETDSAPTACTPPPPDALEEGVEGINVVAADASAVDGGKEATRKTTRRIGPFLEDSDSEDEDVGAVRKPSASKLLKDVSEMNAEDGVEDNTKGAKSQLDELGAPSPIARPLLLDRQSTSFPAADEVNDDFEGIEDFEDEDLLEGEEFDERRWMKEQRRLEMAECGFEGELEDDMIPADIHDGNLEEQGIPSGKDGFSSSCPICNLGLDGISDEDASIHVNNCLDGNPSPLPKPRYSDIAQPPIKIENTVGLKKAVRPAKPGQANPFSLGSTSTGTASAFSKLMAGHAEDAAWATAAAAENTSRGKPAYQRTCPFYKILPGFFICVDAFRYGAVEGCQAYFLSHFHSDHYIGLTSSWSHGPIYCSKVTANLVKQQLRVDPKWVVPLEFEQKVEVPGTEGVHVTMIPANHCPGSSLFLYEKDVGKGPNPRMQRVLHCGDFRACRAHIEHPLLRPDVVDSVSGKTGQQKIDVCYLDTTYLNPKYAFPKQQEVIKACADMCVSLNKVRPDETDGWEQMKRERAGQGMIKFVNKDSDVKQETSEDTDSKARGRLLVVVGTYSIGKERICIGIAKALGSKIYAPPAKQRICGCLEDLELSSLLTSDPREAQVHMTPLFEIRADTLDDYLKDYREYFSRAVGFRPSGWNYRPPNSRFVESPSVQTVLHSQNWKSTYTMRELVPQRGSTSRAACFGVPYSEHSSFRELTMFCCALRIDKIIPTVNVGSAKSREKMKGWCEKWAVERKKNGLFKLGEDGW